MLMLACSLGLEALSLADSSGNLHFIYVVYVFETSKQKSDSAAGKG